MNSLIGMSVSAASPKPHTTRKNIFGIFTDESTQIVFHDSPGFVTADHCKKHHLDSAHRIDPEKSAAVADMILVIVDAANVRDRSKLNSGIIQLLHSNRDKPSVLVLNKVDIVHKKTTLLDTANHLSDGIVDGVPVEPSDSPLRRTDHQDGQNLDKVMERMMMKGYIIDKTIEYENATPPSNWSNFSRVFMVSAKTGDGVQDLLRYLVSRAKPGDWRYSCDLPTPRSPLSIVSDIFREHILNNLDREAPYLISCLIQSWSHDPRTGSLAIYVDFIAPNDKYASALLGSKGATIQKISMAAKEDISNVFECDVKLKVAVKSKRSKYT